MKKYVVMFTLPGQSIEEVTEAARIICGRGLDLVVAETDDRDDPRTLAQLWLPGHDAAMAWSSEVTCAGWTCRVEFDARAELGAVSFVRAGRSEACMVLTATHMRDLLHGIASFPVDLIDRIADRGSGVCL